MPLAQRHAKSWLWIFTGLALLGMGTSIAVAQPPEPDATLAPPPEPIRPGEAVIRVLTPRLEVRLLEQQSKVLEFASHS